MTDQTDFHGSVRQYNMAPQYYLRTSPIPPSTSLRYAAGDFNNVIYIYQIISIDIISRIRRRCDLAEVQCYYSKICIINISILVHIVGGVCAACGIAYRELRALAGIGPVRAVKSDVIIILILCFQEEAGIIKCAIDIALYKLSDVNIIIPVIRQSAGSKHYRSIRHNPLSRIISIEPVTSGVIPWGVVSPVIPGHIRLIPGKRAVNFKYGVLDPDIRGIKPE